MRIVYRYLAPADGGRFYPEIDTLVDRRFRTVYRGTVMSRGETPLDDLLERIARIHAPGASPAPRAISVGDLIAVDGRGVWQMVGGGFRPVAEEEVGEAA